MINRIFLWVVSTCAIIFLLTGFCYAQISDQEIVLEKKKTSHAAVDDFNYIIGAEDVLYVHVWKEKDLSVTTTVRMDGKISLPLIDDVMVAGLTTLQLKQILINFKENKMSNPSNFKFAKTDEWVSVEGNVATIGVSDYAQSQLSDIVYLEFLVEPGDDFSKGDSLVTLESVKAAADVSSPVSGKVVEINEALTDDFEAVNADPFGRAWMVKVELSDPSELDSLMTADAYTTYCEERDH